jgi:rod shape-determining protein MreC
MALIALLVAVLILPTPVSRRARGIAAETLAPVQGLISGTIDRFGNASQAIRGWGGLPEENKKLAEENLVLTSRVRELQSLEQENIVLRDQLMFKKRTQQKLLGAEVVARNISGWWRSVRLDKGWRDGVGLDQAVVNADGLVGKIFEVSERTSDVLLISDPNCRLSVFIGGQASHGILSGKGVSRRGHAVCEMTLINKDLPVTKGAEVISSGLGGVFPRGWRVGFVDSVLMDSTGLYQSADIMPSADLNNLQVVFVVLMLPAGLPAVPADGRGS